MKTKAFEAVFERTLHRPRRTHLAAKSACRFMIRKHPLGRNLLSPANLQPLDKTESPQEEQQDKNGAIAGLELATENADSFSFRRCLLRKHPDCGRRQLSCSRVSSVFFFSNRSPKTRAVSRASAKARCCNGAVSRSKPPPQQPAPDPVLPHELARTAFPLLTRREETLPCLP